MIKIWTDGSCLGNPGPGGWAFVATDGENTAERCGGERDTTNNKMELTAVIRALIAAQKNHDTVEIHTDSQYVKNGMQLWIKNWKKNGWKTADKKPVKNKELWQELDELASKVKIHWHWVRGHNGNEMNERCDELARGAAEKICD
ncbi:MAG: ribonuclease HI [Alphaproteobacteria bacterium]